MATNEVGDMISDLIINEDEGTQKPSMIIDDECEIRIIFDDEYEDVVYLIFESLEERAVIALEVNDREKASSILINAFERIGELVDEAD